MKTLLAVLVLSVSCYAQVVQPGDRNGWSNQRYYHKYDVDKTYHTVKYGAKVMRHLVR